MDSAFKKVSPPKRRAPILWRDAFNMLQRAHHPRSFFFEHVKEAAEKCGIEIQPESLRVKLARYTAKGFLIKTGRKEYRITPKGSQFFDLLKKDL